MIVEPIRQLDIWLQEQYRAVGNQHDLVLSNGTKLIGKLSDDQPFAYVHEVFPGLSAVDIDRLQSMVGRELPQSLREWYKLHNGLRVYCGQFSIYGLREGLEDRKSIISMSRPYDLVTANVSERPDWLHDNQLDAGGYESDDSLFVLSNVSTRVIRCHRDSGKVIEQWSSFDVAIRSEFTRLRSHWKETHM